MFTKEKPPLPMKGKAIIFCAPSGSGKTTIVKHLLDKYSNLGFSISACTRDKRGRNEENGKDYYFLDIQLNLNTYDYLTEQLILELNYANYYIHYYT